MRVSRGLEQKIRKISGIETDVLAELRVRDILQRLFFDYCEGDFTGWMEAGLAIIPQPIRFTTWDQ